ncbi:cadherin-10-like isoform X2 [Crotalus tigris]|uniref:cadherin-10-like isoform X2 n=1 Tax=Crotalus tigris TaxID=88082 RepID=UPI00192FB36F|nr:cadherin-10-like isoform X2 [Crotalus tigris]
MYYQKWISFALILIHVGPCLPCMHNCNTKEMEPGLMRSQNVKHSRVQSLLVAEKEMMSTLPLKSGQLKFDLDKQDNSLKDNGPQFLDGPYEATVPEMSPEGTSVIQVTATYPTDVRLIYSILPEQPYFSVEPTSGVVRTAYPGDRETQDKYFVVIKATVEQIGGPSGTTTVTINLSDVNDNPPRFQHKRYEMNVSEAAPVGTILGKIMANDSDIGDNAAMDYIIEEDNPHIVYIITNNETQEGIVILNKTVDYESQRAYKIKVKGINRHVEKRFLEKDTKFEDETILRIIVKDADEPPVFVSEEFFMEVAEDNWNGSFVGTVSARDPDDIDSPIRYSIAHSKYLKTFFSINDHNGTISITEPLDREKQIWHNLTVTAIESINPKQMSEVNVYIKVLDANEYAPEFAEYYETYVCENSRAGQLIQTISAVDKDDAMKKHNFSFYLMEESKNNSSFELEDNEIFVLAVVALKHQTKPAAAFHEKGEIFRENIFKYDDEGGGEQDTEAFDISALRPQTVLRQHKPRRNITTEIQSLYRQSLQVGPESAIFREFINQKLEEANCDPNVPPYDSLQIFAFEGTGSLAGSLSSLESNSVGSLMDDNYDYLVELRPQVKSSGSMNNYSLAEC